MNICDENVKTIEDPLGKVYAPNKLRDVNLKVFDIKKVINESKILPYEHI